MTIIRLVRFTAILLIAVLMFNNLGFAAKKPSDPAVMKARVQARGVGRGVRVTLADNNEARGLIVSIGDLSFAVIAKTADQLQEI